MGKRKASTSPPTSATKIVNGACGKDDEALSGYSASYSTSELSSTPKRRLPSVSPSKLHFEDSSSSISEDCGSDTWMESSLRKLNTEFLDSCGVAVKKNGATCLVPLLKTYLYETRMMMENNDIVIVVPAQHGISDQTKASFQSLGVYFQQVEKECHEREGNISRLAGGQESNFFSGLAPKQNVAAGTRLTSVPPKTAPAARSHMNEFDKAASEQKMYKNAKIPINSSLVTDFRFGPVDDESRELKKPVFAFGPTTVSVPSNSTSTALTSSFSSGSNFQTSTSGIVKSREETALHGSELLKFPMAPKNGFMSPSSSFSQFSKSDEVLKSVSGPSNSEIETQPPFASTFSFNPPPMKPCCSKDIDKEDGDEEQEKYELKPVVEADSLYSVRCKVFNMINGQYKDKGVGQLYIKELDDGKHQVVVRADNNLGTILLNLLLRDGQHLQKKSAKDVMTVDPVGDGGKPMTVILRLKSEEEASKLLERLQDFSNHSS